MRRALVVLLALAAATPAPTAALAAAAATPVQSEIESEVMCPVCGTLLGLAESPQAKREKAFIARLIASGRSKEEIKDALVAEYGSEVLALPPRSGFDLSAYLVPLIGFLVAAVVVAFALLRWRRRGDDPPGGGKGARRPSTEDQARLEADLARYDL